MHFTINIPPRTKKNSMQIVKVGPRLMILPSKAYRDYEKACEEFMPKIDPIDYPINVKAIYYMESRRRVDLCNLHEALCDALVKYGVVADDNSKIIVSLDGSYVSYDKEHPRTEVYISEVRE